MRTVMASHCQLVPQIATHAPEMYRVLSDPAIYEFENEPPRSLEQLSIRFAKLETRASPDGTEQWLNWVIRLPDGHLAGYVQATVLPTGVAFIAYELNSRYWRKGIGSSAVRAMMAELSASYGVHTFVAVLKAANFRSEALLQHLGFAHGDADQQAAYRDEPDEIVMLRTAPQSADTATPAAD
jgi:ribosomal-protein-alanine N-acetyltransferase